MKNGIVLSQYINIMKIHCISYHNQTLFISADQQIYWDVLVFIQIITVYVM